MREKKNYTMKELPESEKPYEKCVRSGAGALSDAELLAVIIKTGTRERTSLSLAMEVLKLHPSFQGLMGLYHLTYQDLMKVKGIGRVKAVQLLCMVELSKRLARETKEEVVRLNAPSEAAAFFMSEMRCLEQEHLYVAYLDASGRLLHYQVVFIGTIQSSLANPREILRLALQYDAAHYLVLHNHPSGDPTPSREDIDITKRLMEASEIVGIPLMDHIIIGDNQYISLKERGYIED
ncbi:MAG: DNA repair protein RadC [Lachnospiraceae bacterium]|nr:DNA repair protein RadC [Lachnospiraceae bacterium]